jgi:prepilin-type N-terminal cleavage/methylation domain-containing protein
MAEPTITPTLRVGSWMNKHDIKSNCIDPDIQNPERRAFTFVEVIVALLIVSISLVTLTKLNLVSITIADRAEATSKAALLAQQKIAEILASGYPDIQTQSGITEEDSLALQWQTSVTKMNLPIPDNAIKRLRKVSVDISWEQGTAKRNLKISTCVADRRL